MVRGHAQRGVVGGAGFSVLEVAVVVAVIGIATASVTPNLLAVWRTSILSSGVAELSATLSSARRLAVTENTSVCVQAAGTGVRLRMPGCTGAVWTGPGADSSGLLGLSNGLSVEGDTSIVFTRLGAAVPAGTLTVRDRADGRARRVVVAATGLVSTP